MPYLPPRNRCNIHRPSHQYQESTWPGVLPLCMHRHLLRHLNRCYMPQHHRTVRFLRKFNIFCAVALPSQDYKEKKKKDNNKDKLPLRSASFCNSFFPRLHLCFHKTYKSPSCFSSYSRFSSRSRFTTISLASACFLKSSSCQCFPGVFSKFIHVNIYLIPLFYRITGV